MGTLWKRYRKIKARVSPIATGARDMSRIAQDAINTIPIKPIDPMSMIETNKKKKKVIF